ncbi:MAG: hypothetical protein NVSMB42_13590 [Herpetosiphon sp.]
MTALHSFFRLSTKQQRLITRTAVVLVAIRIALWVLPFRIVCKFVLTAKPTASRLGFEAISISDIAWAVTAVSRYVPSATCLTQALAAHILVKHDGFPALLRIGVAKTSTGHFQAHAWLESEGRIVVGQLANLTDFTILPPLRMLDL